MRASFSSWLQLAGWTADVPAAAADMHEEGSDRYATRAPRMPASLASPRRRLFGGRSCRDAARDSAMCPMAGRTAGMARAAFQQCSMMSGRCPSISDIPPAAAAFGRSCIPGHAWASRKGERPRAGFWRALWGLGATSASVCLPQPYRGIVRIHAATRRHEGKPVSDEVRAQYTSANAVGRDMSEGTLP